MSNLKTHQVFTGAVSAYDLARTLLMERGIKDADRAYAALPDMMPRTVRRIFERGSVLDSIDAPDRDGVLTYDVLSSKEVTYVPTCTHSIPVDCIPEVAEPAPDAMTELAEKAKKAGVNVKSAISAVLRFGNPLERVSKVLDDLVTLAGVKEVRSPSGLFVHCMRHRKDITLPEAAKPKKQEAKHPPLQLGEWVRWNCQWMRVMVIRGLQVLLSPSGDMDDTYKINADQILHLPRKDALPCRADLTGT